MGLTKSTNYLLQKRGVYNVQTHITRARKSPALT